MLVSQQTTKNSYKTTRLFNSAHDGDNDYEPTIITDSKPDFSDLDFVFADFAIENEDAPLVSVGDTVHCIDDFTGKRFAATYLGWYEDFNRNGETSPYFSEAYGYEEIHRVVVRRCDGGLDYILPENCFSEAQVSKYWTITVKVEV